MTDNTARHAPRPTQPEPACATGHCGERAYCAEAGSCLAEPEQTPVLEWAVRAENGVTCRASEQVARASVDGGYTAGVSRSPIVAALFREGPEDAWHELSVLCDPAGRRWRDPGAALADLRAREAAGERVDLYCFFGHHGRPGTVGPWVLSQWWPAAFSVDGVTYPNAEVFMMTAKARLFGDVVAVEELSRTSDPKEAKAIGRRVRGFDQDVWDEHAYQLVAEGNLAKFGQHPELAVFLASTGSATLVEASPYDRVWGIGLRADDPRARSPRQWRGRNMLGFALTEVRGVLAGRR